MLSCVAHSSRCCRRINADFRHGNDRRKESWRTIASWSQVVLFLFCFRFCFAVAPESLNDPLQLSTHGAGEYKLSATSGAANRQYKLSATSGTANRHYKLSATSGTANRHIKQSATSGTRGHQHIFKHTLALEGSRRKVSQEVPPTKTSRQKFAPAIWGRKVL